MPLESSVVLAHEDITAQLARRLVDVSQRNTDYMVQRGVVPSRRFSTFVYDLVSPLSLV